MYITNNENNLIITFKYNPAIVHIVTKIEGRIFNNKNKEWSIPIIHVITVVDTLTPIGFKSSQKVLQLYDDKNTKDLKIRQILEGNVSQKKIDQVKQLQLPLFDYQQKGVYFLTERGSGLLGDEPGLGKSVQSLATTLITKSIRNLIVCPASLKLQWEEEIKKWIKHAKVYVVTGTKKQRDEIYNKAKKEKKLYYVIINYELILRDIDILQTF